jgi:pyridoxal 5'-phosphate synthase pdxT subunit
LILLAESANRTKRGGQELIGGLDVRVNRNHFGRQVESFVTDLDLPFLNDLGGRFIDDSTLFRCIFIRAPIVEKILPYVEGEQKEEKSREDTVIAPTRKVEKGEARKAISREVEVLARLPASNIDAESESGTVVAVRQGNVFGTSFHPELTGDVRIHVWWLRQLMQCARESRNQSIEEDSSFKIEKRESGG